MFFYHLFLLSTQLSQTHQLPPLRVFFTILTTIRYHHRQHHLPHPHQHLPHLSSCYAAPPHADPSSSPSYGILIFINKFNGFFDNFSCFFLGFVGFWNGSDWQIGCNLIFKVFDRLWVLRNWLCLILIRYQMWGKFSDCLEHSKCLMSATTLDNEYGFVDDPYGGLSN
ncbi:uncharacterized protein [Rutidosis leptorrhynchoides]|uniref:uncharacterized protein n=1 Tax=Rutidosis leptorrhynchoides TaxID=125765 RepID=UPI003A991AE8